ncbi:MAG: carboxypeptidase-like regulatory domain-containing protein, partial [Bacteroidales bacterium]|nr:carboxypeptidase-like regulatory domain-containing protein [Bacteroidales bacterium]
MKNVNFKRKRLKLGFLSACCFIFCFSSAVNAQTTAQAITIDQKDKSVGEILKAIESVSDYVFFYNRDDVDRNRKATVQANNASIEKVLDQLFAKTNNGYRIEGRQVYITKKAPAVENPPQQVQVKIKVTGKVLDKANDPVIGGSVIQKGTTTGVFTDVEGNFSMELSRDAVIVVSYLGFVPQEVAVTEQPMTIILREDTKALDEVVIVAYGSQNRGLVTSAISSIGGEELVKLPTASITNNMAGVVPGLTALQTSGQPGKDAAILYLRGVGSLNDELS